MRTFIMSIAMLILLAGCNTMQGLGKDVKEGGAAIERAAKK